MPVPVVTFSIQLGSRGFDIARRVALRLRYNYYDWQITSEAARPADGEPNPDQTGFADRIMNRLAAAAVLEDEVPPSMISPSPAVQSHALEVLADSAYRLMVEEVVRRLASQGKTLIVGHGSQVVLADFPGVLKVLILESAHQRAVRLVDEQGVSLREATQIVAELDGLKTDFFRKAYGIEWLNASYYDVMIKADALRTGQIVDLITAAALDGPMQAPSGEDRFPDAA